MAPVWRAIKVDLNTSLKAGGRSGQSDGGLYLKKHSLRWLLVVSELTLSLMLLIGAGLLIRSFVRLQSVAPGFTTDHVLTMEVAAAGQKYQNDKDDKPIINFYKEIESRVAHLPGVVAEGVVSGLPLTGEVGWGQINVEGYAPPPGQELQADVRVASTDYFRTMEIPLRMGRFFTEDDTADKPQVVIIDEKFAQRFWPDSDPIGKHLWLDPKKPITIVGVVGVVKQYGLETDGKIATYFPLQQFPGPRDVSGGAHVIGSGRAGFSSGERDPCGRSGRGGLRNPDHAGSVVRFAGATALFDNDAGSVCGVRVIVGCHRSLWCDVASGDAEYARYRSASGTRRAAGEHYSACGAAGNGIGGCWNCGGACRRGRVNSRYDQLAIWGKHDRRAHLRDGAGAVGGGSVCRDRHPGMESNASGSDGGAAGGIAARGAITREMGRKRKNEEADSSLRSE